MAILALVCLGCSSASVSAQETPADRPNFVFVITDDQSTDTLAYMPNVRGLQATGTTFENFVMPTATCCPSRATFLRGQYVHNTGMTGGSGGDGPAFAKRNLDESTLATWLDDAGYRTGLFGKYLNGYKQYGYVPPGWDSWMANANRDVWADCFADNGRKRCYNGHPDALLAKRAENFLRADSGAPFFLYLSFGAPHQYENGPPLYQKADAGSFRRTSMPRPPSFNEADVSDKPPWIRQKPRLTGADIRTMGTEYKARLRSLQTVDRSIGRLQTLLSQTGELDNTYIIYVTDNGYHMGLHRLAVGKHMPYKEDHNFPMIVRGPGVQEGATPDELVSSTDFGPTVVDLAEAQAPPVLDGRSAAPLLRGESTRWRDAVLFESITPSPRHGRPAYRGIWTASGWWYTEHGTGQRELYDLDTDPHQLRNVAGDPDRADEVDALSSRLAALKTCAADSCRTAEGR